MKARESLIVERRVIVKGWKVDIYHDHGSRGPEEFVSFHNVTDTDQRFIDSQVARIGADVPDAWQPHITEVIVEERVVTPWRTTAHFDDSGSKPS